MFLVIYLKVASTEVSDFKRLILDAIGTKHFNDRMKDLTLVIFYLFIFKF